MVKLLKLIIFSDSKMKLLHHVWITVYVKPTDDEETVSKTILKFFPLDLAKEKIKIYRKTAIGFEEKKIIVLQLHIEKQMHIKLFLETLDSHLTKVQKKKLITQKESRLDADNQFFIRFDKSKLVKGNKFTLTDKGNCFHIKMSVAAYPTTRVNALDAITNIFK